LPARRYAHHDHGTKDLKREEKAAVVEDIAGQIEGSSAIFAIDYRGISVPQAAELRSRLRETDASFRVVKNRLTKLAADKAGREELKELLEGPTALTFVRGDTALAAKAIVTFDREHEVLTFKGGYMDGLTLDDERFRSIARLPSRDVLNGQLAGVVASPITGLVRGLNALISGLAIQLGQMAEQGLVTGEAPAEASTEEGSDESAAGPVADDAPSADADSPPSAPPAEETEETPAEAAPVEAEPTESGAEADAPAEGDPSQAEGEGEGEAGEQSIPAESSETESEPPAADAERAEPEDGDSGGEASEQSAPAE
jgi:large subunit ribosomal protein L10